MIKIRVYRNKVNVSIKIHLIIFSNKAELRHQNHLFIIKIHLIKSFLLWAVGEGVSE